MDQTPTRPPACVGTDDFHTPRGLTAGVQEALSLQLDSVPVNAPYAGTMVPGKHWGKDPRVHSVMIEISRNLYMDVSTGEKNQGFAHIAELMAETSATARQRIRASDALK
jgi:N-formylglutamate amidohydrolase